MARPSPRNIDSGSMQRAYDKFGTDWYNKWLHGEGARQSPTENFYKYSAGNVTPGKFGASGGSDRVLGRTPDMGAGGQQQAAGADGELKLGASDADALDSPITERTYKSLDDFNRENWAQILKWSEPGNAPKSMKEAEDRGRAINEAQKIAQKARGQGAERDKAAARRVLADDKSTPKARLEVLKKAFPSFERVVSQEDTDEIINGKTAEDRTMALNKAYSDIVALGKRQGAADRINATRERLAREGKLASSGDEDGIWMPEVKEGDIDFLATSNLARPDGVYVTHIGDRDPSLVTSRALQELKDARTPEEQERLSGGTRELLTTLGTWGSSYRDSVEQMRGALGPEVAAEVLAPYLSDDADAVQRRLSQGDILALGGGPSVWDDSVGEPSPEGIEEKYFGEGRDERPASPAVLAWLANMARGDLPIGQESPQKDVVARYVENLNDKHAARAGSKWREQMGVEEGSIEEKEHIDITNQARSDMTMNYTPESARNILDGKGRIVNLNDLSPRQKDELDRIVVDGDKFVDPRNLSPAQEAMLGRVAANRVWAGRQAPQPLIDQRVEEIQKQRTKEASDAAEAEKAKAAEAKEAEAAEAEKAARFPWVEVAKNINAWARAVEASDAWVRTAGIEKEAAAKKAAGIEKEAAAKKAAGIEKAKKFSDAVRLVMGGASGSSLLDSVERNRAAIDALPLVDQIRMFNVLTQRKEQKGGR